MRVQIILVSALAVLVMLVACGGPKPIPVDRVSLELTWDNDADLDLELWDTVPAHGGRKLAVCHDLPGGVDGVTGGVGERYSFYPPYDSGVFVIAVSFWSPGPSKDTDVVARLSVHQAVRGAPGLIFSATLNDDNRDIWFPIAIDVRTGKFKPIGEFAYRGL